MNFITFSRRIGTNGSEIARRVADQLGYRFYDTEAIENAAREMGFLESVREIDEKAPSLFQSLFSHRPTIDLDRLNSVIYELSSRADAAFLECNNLFLRIKDQCNAIVDRRDHRF